MTLLVSLGSASFCVLHRTVFVYVVGRGCCSGVEIYKGGPRPKTTKKHRGCGAHPLGKHMQRTKHNRNDGIHIQSNMGSNGKPRIPVKSKSEADLEEFI